MNDIQKAFKFRETAVRTVIKDGEPWFVGKDVCDILGYVNARQTVGKLDEDEKGVCLIDTLGGNQAMLIVNESGLYTLILSSHKQEAKAFKRWVTHEVLPSIRKTGTYSLPANASILSALSAALGEEKAERLREISETSEQIRIGFGFHDENYTTFEDVQRIFGIPRGPIINDMISQGLMEEQYFPKDGKHKLSFPLWQPVLTRAGEDVAEQVWNRRKGASKQYPLSTRTKKEVMVDFIKPFLVPEDMLYAARPIDLEHWKIINQWEGDLDE